MESPPRRVSKERHGSRRGDFMGLVGLGGEGREGGVVIPKVGGVVVVLGRAMAWVVVVVRVRKVIIWRLDVWSILILRFVC